MPIPSTPSYLNYWGKSADRPDGGVDWHPLAYHALDVAAVGRALLDRHSGLRSALARCLDWPEEAVAAVMPPLLALHDLGKFSRPFQKKRPELMLAKLGLPGAIANTPHHDTAGLLFWKKRVGRLLAERHGLDDDALRPLARAVVGHHGMPPSDDASVPIDVLFGAAAADALAFVHDAIATVTPKMSNFPELDEIRSRRASWLVAGIAVLADWVGSNRAWFPYRAPNEDLATYWRAIAEPNAKRALDAAGIVPAPRATANAIYDRLADTSAPRYRNFFADGGKPSLVLAHGGRDVHDRLQATIGPRDGPMATTRRRTGTAPSSRAAPWSIATPAACG